MTTYLIDPSPADAATLQAENARLRVAIAHLAVYGRSVLECRDNGALTLAHQGYPAYQASHALAALEESVTRALAGDWRPATPAQIDAAFARHARRFWGTDYLTSELFSAAMADLLWHPERQYPAASAPTLPVDGTVAYDQQPQ